MQLFEFITQALERLFKEICTEINVDPLRMLLFCYPLLLICHAIALKHETNCTPVKVTVEDLNPTRKKLVVVIPGDTISQAEDSIAREFAGQAKIPGFRPGKAPANLVKKRFAKDIEQEVSRKLTSEAYEKASSETDLNIFTVVDLSGDEYQPGIDAHLEMTVDIIPDFELPEYKGLSMNVSSTEASEEEVEQSIQQLREQRAQYNVVERPAQKGDFVRCSYTGKIGDQLIADLAPDARMFGTQNSTWEEAGSEESPGVRAVVDGLVGMAPGDTKEVEMEFPEDFSEEVLRGKKATYSVELEEVRERELPELDEQFLQSLQVESEEELRKQTRENIQNQKNQANASGKREQIQQKLLDQVDFPVPQSAVEQQTQDILRDFLQRYMQQGVPQEEFENRKDELYEGASKAAVDRVKVRLVLGRIAEKESIEVENEDMSSAIMQEAMMTRTQPEKLVKELQKDRGRIQALRESVLMNKTLEFLIENGELVEAETPAESGEAAAEEEETGAEET